MIGTIYALADLVTGDIRYCGKTIKPPSYRMSAHRRDAKTIFHRHLYNWWRSLPREPKLIICEQINLDGISRDKQLELLNAAERRWVSYFKEIGVRLTNATIGGDGCHGRVVSEETRKKAAESNRGKKRSAETCEKIRIACLSKPPSAFLRGEKHQHYRKIMPWLPRHRASIGKSISK